MVTEEEREEIISKAVERTLLSIPEVIGNLMVQQVTQSKMNKEFYTKYPEFNKRRDAVVSVIESIDGENPLLSYGEILEKAVPVIRERIKTVDSLSVESSGKLNLEYKPDETGS